MTEQLAWTIAAAAVGFVAAVLFCIGNAFNAAEDILSQATPYWGFSQPLARAFATQRAQYAVGAVMLFLAFVLQLAAALAPSDRAASLPSSLNSWWSLLAGVLLPVAVVSWIAVRVLLRATYARVLRLQATQRAAQEQKANAPKPKP